MWSAGKTSLALWAAYSGDFLGSMSPGEPQGGDEGGEWENTTKINPATVGSGGKGMGRAWWRGVRRQRAKCGRLHAGCSVKTPGIQGFGRDGVFCGAGKARQDVKCIVLWPIALQGVEPGLVQRVFEARREPEVGEEADSGDPAISMQVGERALGVGGEDGRRVCVERMAERGVA